LVYVALPPLIKVVDANPNTGNFPKLDLIDIVNNLRPKYAMKLYEYFKVLEGINT